MTLLKYQIRSINFFGDEFEKGGTQSIPLAYYFPLVPSPSMNTPCGAQILAKVVPLTGYAKHS